MPTAQELRAKFVLPIDVFSIERMRCEKSR